MHQPYIFALLLGAWSANAFQNTSPFLYASTSNHQFTAPQISRSSALLSSISSQILGAGETAPCDSKNFIIVNQPGLAAIDLQGSASSPTLHSLLSKKGISRLQTSFAVPEVIDGLSEESLRDILVARCGGVVTRVEKADQIATAASNDKNIFLLDLPALKGPGRREQLKENDLILLTHLNNWESTDFTLFYTSTPPSPSDLQEIAEGPQYIMDDSQSPIHLDLKRDLSMHSRADNTTLPDGPLFERYQYFTPGIFMGLITFLFLIAIGTIGIRALSSLEVSYAAFDKENGPQAQQKKAQ